MDFEKIFGRENTRFVLNTLDKLEPDLHKPAIVQLINNGVVNIWLVLAYLAKITKVERYMEIGVRRGFSMALVAGRRPHANMVGFDMWIADYAGAPNPGVEFVRSELEKVGFRGVAEFIDGDSAKTVPDHHPAVLYQLILVDGDHSTDGVYRDVTNSLRLLAPGGYLVLDDLQDDAVMEAWERVLADTCGSMRHYQRDRVGVLYYGD